MDKGIVADIDAVAGGSHAQTKIVVFKIADTEAFVYSADLFDDPAIDAQAQSDCAIGHVAVTLPARAPFRRILVHFGDPRICGIGCYLMPGNSIAARRGDAEARDTVER